MKLKLLYYPHPILRQRCEPITEITDEIRQLARDMIEACLAHNGVGIAAPQIGKAIRMFILHNYIISPDGKWSMSPPSVYINPKITPVGTETQTEDEGCISVPGINVPVERPYKIVIEATDLEGRRFTEEVEWINARVRMHENDHLNGVLNIDRTDPKSRKKAEAHLQRLKKKYKDQ